MGMPTHASGVKKVVCVGGGTAWRRFFRRRARSRKRFIRIGILGFRNQDLIFWEDKFRACCDELIVWPTKFRPLLSVALSLG
jgi:hypothetical protein